MNTKTFSVIVSAPDRTPEAVKERLNGTGLKAERIDTPIENPKERKPEKFYHFYESNRYVGSAFGTEQARVLLDERKSKWGEFHDNVWSDGGDIEESLYPLAPSRNDSGEMDHWLKKYPDWKG